MSTGDPTPQQPQDPQQPRLTHIDPAGAARMVDVSAKQATVRTARASGRVRVSPRVVELLRGEGVPKGDALAVARIAGIMGAKRTPDLVPLCHPIALSGVTVDLTVTDTAVEISATVRTADRTGVEMEALTAVTVAALTVVDMVKAVDKAAVIEAVQVEEKTGGKSGDYHRAPAPAGGAAPGRKDNA
ncbi:cyclic pyranopterin monophosphate synthase MoaC [Streptomyces capparidis]